MRHLGAFFVVTTAIGLAGCGQIGGSLGSNSRGGMAVVDLDKVAAETGRSRQLAQTVKMEENSLNQRWVKTVENANEQLEAKKKGYGEELTDAEQKELLQMTASAKTQLSQIQNQTRLQFEQFKNEQIAQFRAEIKPIAQEIAAKRGLAVVIPKNEGLLLSVDPGVDITDEVIKIMREKHPVPMAIAPPTTQTETPSQVSDAEATPRKVPTKRNSSPAKNAGSNRSAKNNDETDSFR